MMPPMGAPLTAEEIAKIKSWIDAGAKFPAVMAKSTHWSFQPIQRPAKTSIDAFVRERLAKENIAPSPEADRRTLIRRVSLDLTRPSADAARSAGRVRCRRYDVRV